MRALPTLFLTLLFLGFIFAGLASQACATSKPIPKEADETEYPTLELLVSIVLIVVAAMSFELFRQRRLKR